MVTWDRGAAAHLLRRAGFGAPPAEVDRAVKAGRQKTVDRLLRFRPSDDHYRGKNDYDLRRWWFQRMLRTRVPLQEKLTLFWHGHFATSIAKVGDTRMMSKQNALFRRLGAGPFHDLLLGVAQDPAMVVFLDNQTNVAGSANENFAREVMELFTLGVRDDQGNPNYTQADVRDAARAFTGWGLGDRNRFEFHDYDHDHGQKTVLGLTGDLDGTDVVSRLASMPQCARRIGQKLWAFFAYPDPEPAVADALQQAWLDNGGTISEVLRTLFLRDEFHSARAAGEHVASPVEYTVGTIRSLGGKTDAKDLPYISDLMGQDLFQPPNVAGWPGGLHWMSSVTRLHRFRFGWDVATARSRHDRYLFIPVEELLRKLPAGAGAAEVVDRVLEATGASGASAGTRAALVAYMGTAEDGSPVPFDPGDPDAVDRKVRGLVGLALMLPEASLA